MKLSYYGYFTPFGGYGIANLNWVKHLRRLGEEVSVNAKFVPRPGTDEWKVLSDEEREMFDAPFEKHRVGIIETTPDYFYLNECEVKVANTMSETDRLGDDWVRKCNTMDRIIVPNYWNFNVFRNSGVTTKMHVIPHGVDVERYKYFDRSKRSRPEYIFGMCGYLNKRKAVFEVIQAFHSEFDSGENVKLRLHTTDPELGYYKNLADDRIEITSELWDFDKLVEFYNDLDCFVFPSRAEGVGYPPREAMATGLPTIVLNYSGLEDIAGPALSIEPDGFANEHPMIEQVGKWANVNIQDLMGAMRYAYNNPQKCCELGKFSSKFIQKTMSWQKSASKLKDFLYDL